MDVYTKIGELGYQLPELPPRGGIYKPVKQVNNLLYISGQGATVEGVPKITGKIGDKCSLEDGQEAAQLCVLNALSVLHDYLGDLNRIKGVVKMLSFVASAPGFNSQPAVADGASKFLSDIWGDAGVGSRTAIGVNELPGDIAVEIEFIFEIE